MSWQVEFTWVPSAPDGPLRFGGWIVGLDGDYVELSGPNGVQGGDPYPDLLLALHEVTHGSGTSVVMWTNEQDRYEWSFARRGDDVAVCIKDIGPRSDELMLQKTVRLRELVRAITTALPDS